MEPLTIAILTGLACVAFTVQTATGFGAGLVLVTLGALVIPIQDAVTLLIPLSVAQTVVVLVRHHGAIAWGLLLKLILPVMAGGAAVGQLLVQQLQGPVWKQAYGVLIVLFALRELVRLRAPSEAAAGVAAETTHRSRWLAAGLATFVAGIVQGIYATGGPPLVWALDRLRLDKQAFRTTLLAVFLGINVALTVWFAASGRLGAAQVAPLAWMFGGVLGGLLIGEWAHDRVDEQRFRLGVYLLLVLAGGALVAG